MGTSAGFLQNDDSAVQDPADAEPGRTRAQSCRSRSLPLSGAFSVAIPWGLLGAGVVASLPLILLVAIFQKRIVAGLTAGSLK